MQQAAQASGRPQEDIDRAPRMPLRAPLVIVVVARAKESNAVPLFEQQLAAGCAVMAMQMAAFAQGFAGVWRSGWPMRDENLAGPAWRGRSSTASSVFSISAARQNPTRRCRRPILPPSPVLCERK